MATKAPSFDVTLKRRVASVCDLHRVPCGSATDLAGFLKLLESNKLLAMDFWGIVGGVHAIQDAVAGGDSRSKAREGEGSEERLETKTLDVIVRVVTGQHISEIKALGGEAEQAAHELTTLIAGEDTHFPAYRQAAKLEAAKADESGGSRYQSMGTERARLAAPKAMGEERTGSSSAGRAALGRATLKQPSDSAAWSRLLNTDWIAVDAQAAQQKIAEETDPISYAYQPDRDDALRRVLLQDGDPKVIEATAPTEREALWSWLKLPAWLGEPRLVGNAVIGLGVLGLVFSLSMMVRNHGWLHRVESSVRGTWNELSGGEEAPAGTKADQTAAKPSGPTPGRRHKADVNALKLVETAAAREKNPRTNADDGAHGTASRTTDAVGGVTDTVPVEVQADVMRANLIVAPPPVNGPGQGVVLRAVISKAGEVVSLRVVEGDKALWAAAKQTVSTWRYRPYLVNDKPVAVTTTVNVTVKVDP